MSTKAIEYLINISGLYMGIGTDSETDFDFTDAITHIQPVWDKATDEARNAISSGLSGIQFISFSVLALSVEPDIGPGAHYLGITDHGRYMEGLTPLESSHQDIIDLFSSLTKAANCYSIFQEASAG